MPSAFVVDPWGSDVERSLFLDGLLLYSAETTFGGLMSVK